MVLLFATSVFAEPTWYANYALKGYNQIYYGYGQGSTKDEAYQNAASEISQQIEVEIFFSLKREDRIRNDNLSSNIKSSISTNSSVTLKNLIIKKSTKENNTFYILLEYKYTIPSWFENRSVEAPLFFKIGYGLGSTYDEAIKGAKRDLISQGIEIQRAIKPMKSEIIVKRYFVAVSYQTLPKLKCGNSQNSFLAHSVLIKEANKLTICIYDYELKYYNNAWYLTYKTIAEKLTPRAFGTFFINIKNANISISSPKHDLKEGEGFYININSHKDGYVSILDIYENGRVGVLLNNRKIKAKSHFTYPDLTSGKEFVASLLTPSTSTKDLYIAIYSKNRLNLSMFETQSANTVTDKEYRFNEVVKLLSTYDYATLVLRMRPN
jgi:hypothetical protein